MNPEFPQTPREQLEARLTALLLGELSAEDAAEAYRAIERDAELAQLHERLKQTIGLVREVAASPIAQTAAQPAAMKLSAARRDQLLERFKTVAPKEFAPERRRETPWFIPMSLAAALVALIGSVALLPAFRNGADKLFAELSSEPHARARAQRVSSETLVEFEKETMSALKRGRGWAAEHVDKLNRAAEKREDNGRTETLSLPPTKNADELSSRHESEGITHTVSVSGARNYTLNNIELPPVSGPSGAPELPAVTGLAAAAAPERPKQKLQETNQKLANVVLPEVRYDNLPLAEVAKDLAEQSRKISPPVPSISAISSQGLLGSDSQRRTNAKGPFTVGGDPAADRSSLASSWGEANGAILSQRGAGAASASDRRMDFSAAIGGAGGGLGGGGLVNTGGGGGLGGGGFVGGGGGGLGGEPGGLAFGRTDQPGGVTSSAPEGPYANSKRPLGEREGQASQGGETNRFVGRYPFTLKLPQDDGAKVDASGSLKMDPQMMRRYPADGESLEKSRLESLAQSPLGLKPNAAAPLSKPQSLDEAVNGEERKREVLAQNSPAPYGRLVDIEGGAVVANGLASTIGAPMRDGDIKGNKDAVQGRAGGRALDLGSTTLSGHSIKFGELAQENFGIMPEAGKPNTVTNTVTALPAPAGPVVEDLIAAPQSQAGSTPGLALEQQLARFYSGPIQKDMKSVAVNLDNVTHDSNGDAPVTFENKDALGDMFRTPPVAKESKLSASTESAPLETVRSISGVNSRWNAASSGATYSPGGKIGVQSGTPPSQLNLSSVISRAASGPDPSQSDDGKKLIFQDVQGFATGWIALGDGSVATKSQAVLSDKLSTDLKARPEENGRNNQYFSKDLGLAAPQNQEAQQSGQSQPSGGSGASRMSVLTDEESKAGTSVTAASSESRLKLKKEELAEQRESDRGGQRGEQMLYATEEKLRAASAIVPSNRAQDFEAQRKLEALQQTRDALLLRIKQETADAAPTSSGHTTITATLSVAPKNGAVEIVESAKAEPAQTPSLWQRFGRTLKGDSERTARIKVERDGSDIQPLLLGMQTTESFDPYFIQTEFEKIKSKAVLYRVIEKLNLNEAWAKKQGASAKLTTNETYKLLIGIIDVRKAPNSDLVDIRVKSDKPGEAALIANTIAEVYRDTRQERRKQAALNSTQILKDELAKQEKAIAQAREELERQQKTPNNENADVTPRKPAGSAPVPQPEVQTRENSFSTFSLNVSDVSFKLAAASLEKGVMPDPGTVRSEEFINAFDYRDSEPPPGVPISFAWDRAHYPFAHNRDLLRFSVKTAAEGRQQGRPLNIVLLLDNSGSMERADRVRIIREALNVLAAQLKAEDKFSVVAFARTARLVVDGVPGNQAGQVAERVSNLTPQGGTNLEDAMNLAYQTALRHYVAGGINRVVLLTDGAANLGNVDPGALKKKVEAHRQQGIALDCFGIGWEGYNDDLLEVLSRNGDGRYGFINTPEDASTRFASQLAGALHVAASDVKVQVEFNPKRVTAYRQIGYAKHQLTKEQFRDNTVDAAEIGAAESGNALYAVEVNPRGEGPLAIVRVRYKAPGTTEYHEHEWPVTDSGTAPSLEQANVSMRLAATTSAFSEWLASSPYAAEVTSDKLLAYLSGVPEAYGADPRPKKLEWMIRQARSIAGR